MALSTLRDLFILSEEDATYVLVTYVNSMWRQRHMNGYLVSVKMNCIANYDFNDGNIAP